MGMLNMVFLMCLGASPNSRAILSQGSLFGHCVVDTQACLKKPQFKPAATEEEKLMYCLTLYMVQATKVVEKP